MSNTCFHYFFLDPVAKNHFFSYLIIDVFCFSAAIKILCWYLRLSSASDARTAAAAAAVAATWSYYG